MYPSFWLVVYLQHVHFQKSCHLIHILAACTPVYSGWWHRSPSFMCYAFQSSSFSHTGSVITHLFLLLQDPAAVLNEVGLLAGLKTLSAWWGTKLRLSLTTLSPLWRETGNNNIYMVGISFAWKSIHLQSIIHVIFKLLLSKVLHYEGMPHDGNSTWLLEFTNLWEEIFIRMHTFRVCMDGSINLFLSFI